MIDRDISPVKVENANLREYNSFEACGELMAGKRRTYREKLTFILACAPWLMLFPLLITAAGCSLIGDGLPPTVFFATPSDGSGNVPVTALITATLSRPMDASTLTTSSFTLTQGGVPVPGSVTCSGKTATFTPASNLPGNSLLTATITTAARDVSGVAVPRDQVWSFMTVSGPAGSTGMYYVMNVSGTWSRSSTPVTIASPNVVSQSANPDGSVTFTITGATGYEDNGFYFYAGPLQNLGSLRIVGTGAFSANLYLDVDGDNEFFLWSSNVYTPGGPDVSKPCPAPVNGVITIDSSTLFTFGASSYTLSQLRAGSGGVTASTRAGFWIGISTSSGNQTATITSVRPN